MIKYYIFYGCHSGISITNQLYNTFLSKDFLLISEISSHAVKLLLGCLSVQVPDVFQDLQQSLLHSLGHLDLPADIDVAAFSNKKTYMKH